MRVDFLGLEAFVAIAERGSFARAAHHLNLSHTALSHRMRKLEENLGQRLFLRTAREVTLTEAGLQLLPTARRAMEDIAGSLAELRREGRERQTKIGIGCLPTLAIHHLPRALKRFEALHPEVNVRVYDNSAAQIAGRVKAGEAEFGVTIVTSQVWDLEIERLAEEPFLLVCPRAHPLAERPAADWGDLAGVPLIRISPEAGNRVIIDDALGERRETLCWRYEVQHVATAASLVEAGVGLAVLPRLAVSQASNPALAMLELRNPAISRTLGLLTRRAAPLSPLSEVLRRFVVEEIADAFRRR